MPMVINNIARPDKELINAFRDISPADAHEAMDQTHAMDAEISPVTDTTALCGPAVTVRLPAGDNMSARIAVNAAEPGDVIVIESKSSRAATWGEIATNNAQLIGLEGVVTDGNVRDIEEIAALEFPVFARDVSHIGAVKETPGSVNIPVSVGETIVRPGDIILGDGDGITVVPQGIAAEVRDRAEKRIEYEDNVRQRIQDGETLYEIFEYDAELEKYDITQYDEIVDYSGSSGPNEQLEEDRDDMDV